MNSDAMQKNAMVGVSNNVLDGSKPWKENLVILSRVLSELKRDNFFDALPVAKRNSLRKCLDETETVIAEVGVVAERAETEQDEQALNESVTELTNSVTALVDRFNVAVANNGRERRIFWYVASLLILMVVSEVILWLVLFVSFGASIRSPHFAIFTFVLIPQMMFVYLVALWKLGERIVSRYSRASYKRKQI